MVVVVMMVVCHFSRIAMLLLQYVLPLAIICFAYIRIWIKLRNHVGPAGRNDRHQHRRKTTKMLVMMVRRVLLHPHTNKHVNDSDSLEIVINAS